MRDLRNYINNVANQHKEPVDNDALWAGIEQKMKSPERKRRLLPFWVWGLSISLVVFSICFYTLDDHRKPIVDKGDMEPIDVIDHEQLSEVNPINKSEPWIIERLEDDYIRDNPQELFEMANNENIQADVSVIKHESISSTLNLRPGENQYIDSQSHFKFNKHSAEEITLNTEYSISEKSQNSFVPLPNTFNKEIRMVEYCKMTSSSGILYKRPKIDLPPAYPPPRPLRSRTNKKTSILKSITIYSQYGFGDKTIEGSSIYSEMRNDSEELLEQLRFGIESDIFNVLDFTFYGGISFVSINDRVEVAEEYFEDRDLYYLKSITKAPDGSEIENYVTESLPHLVNNNAIRYNSHRLVSMPIGMRFGKRFSNFSFGIGIGLDFNYQLSGEHTILGLDNRLISQPVGGRWQSPAFHTAVTVEYPISEGWYLHSKFMSRNMTLENISPEDKIKESYSLYGVDLGLKLQF